MKVKLGMMVLAGVFTVAFAHAELIEKDILATHFEGNEVYNGSNYINGWTEVTYITSTLTDTDLNRTQTGAGGSWVEGTLSSKDGGITTWDTGNAGDWTWETRMRVNNNENGVIIWLGTGTHRIFVEIYNDHTQDTGAQSFNVTHANDDGQYHTWRVAHDSVNDRYHAWRDNELLTDIVGAVYDSASTDDKMFIGDYTSGAFGDNYDIDIDYISYDMTGAYAAVPEPATLGMVAAFGAAMVFVRRRLMI